MRRRPAASSDVMAPYLPTHHTTLPSTSSAERQCNWFEWTFCCCRAASRRRFLSVLMILFLILIASVVAIRSGMHILFLRYVVFPMARPRCPLPDATALKVKFGVATVHLPRSGGPITGWTPELMDMYHLSESNKIQYAHNMGYTYFNGTEWAIHNFETQVLHNLNNKGLGSERAVWIKSLYLSHLLLHHSNRMDVDWILYLDTDAIVMNKDFDLTRILVAANVDDTTGVIVSTDAKGINAGVLLVRNNSCGQRIMSAWIRGATEGLARGETDQVYFRKMFEDTTGVLKPEAEGINEKTKDAFASRNSAFVKQQPTLRIVPPCVLQSSGGLERDDKRGRPYWEGAHARGDFVVHFFGRPNKLEQMRIAANGSLKFFS